MPLTASQLATLQAVVNRIVPPDDFPGAWEAGVGDYLLRAWQEERPELGLVWEERMGSRPPLLGDYRVGLDALDQAAQQATGQRFASLPLGDQDLFLTAVEVGEHGQELGRFFGNLVAHTMEGYYGDPGNGGNRDGVGWRMIGFVVTDLTPSPHPLRRVPGDTPPF